MRKLCSCAGVKALRKSRISRQLTNANQPISSTRKVSAAASRANWRATGIFIERRVSCSSNDVRALLQGQTGTPGISARQARCMSAQAAGVPFQRPDGIARLERERGKSIYRRWRSAIDLVKSGTQEGEVLDAHASKRQASYQHGQVR